MLWLYERVLHLTLETGIWVSMSLKAEQSEGRIKLFEQQLCEVVSVMTTMFVAMVAAPLGPQSAHGCTGQQTRQSLPWRCTVFILSDQ